MRKRTIIAAIAICILCLSAVAATALYGQTLKVGGGFDSVGDGGLSAFSNGDIYSNGKGVFLGGVEGYGGFLQAPVELKNEAGQVGLFTGGASTGKGTLLFNGTMFVIDTSDFESPSGMAGVLSIEDYFGYGERPTLALGDANGEGLRLHYDLTSTTTADLYDDDADTTLLIENSDGSHVANAKVEGVLTISGSTLYAGSPGPSDFLLTCPQGDLTLRAKSLGEIHLRAASGTDVTTTNHGEFISTGDLKAEGNDLDLGDAGGFSGVKFNPTSTTLDFYIDGVKVRHVNADGSETDDVP